ncbi:hypothetical protein GGF31_003440 [Allomyces arbusculus]|nr:hypothetical protein GGF31_003440 [Allomyces arbusculus]
MSQLDTANLTVPKAVKVLAQFVELGNSKGAFSLREANLLSKAVDILNEDVQDKPVLVENDPNPEATSIDLLVQAVHVAQSKGAYGLRDASLAYELTEYLRAQASQPAATTQTSTPVAESSSSASKRFGKAKARVQEDHDTTEADDEAFRTVSARATSD